MKFEELHLRVYDTVTEASAQDEKPLRFYNERRPPRSLDGRTPDEIYFNNLVQERVEA